jgi:hypothetical protein
MRSPSPRYLRLIEEYRWMHENGEPLRGIPAEKTFKGHSLLPQVHHVRRLVRETGARTLLDYGSGKGLQYRFKEFTGPDESTAYAGVQAYWGVTEVRCYDPAYAPFSALPTGQFDGVVCTDVLEHCPEEDIDWILGELFAFARLFVFANVACFPALKTLPSGANAHCTVKPAQWWQERIGRAMQGSTGVRCEFRLAYLMGDKLAEKVISG